MLPRVTALPPKSFVGTVRSGTGGSEVGGIITAVSTFKAPPPNPSFKRTCLWHAA